MHKEGVSCWWWSRTTRSLNENQVSGCFAQIVTSCLRERIFSRKKKQQKWIPKPNELLGICMPLKQLRQTIRTGIFQPSYADHKKNEWSFGQAVRILKGGNHFFINAISTRTKIAKIAITFDSAKSKIIEVSTKIAWKDWVRRVLKFIWKPEVCHPQKLVLSCEKRISRNIDVTAC